MKKIFVLIFMPFISFSRIFWLYQSTNNSYIKEYCRFFMRRNGVHISKGADIASGVIFPHPVGIVIGAGVSIESNVIIYQGVTLGLKNYSDSINKKIDKKKYPKIKRGVIIYTNSVIVGGVTIGENSVVAANSVVLKDVCSNTIVFGNPTHKVN